MAAPRNAFRHSLRKLYDYIDSQLGGTTPSATTTTAGSVKQAATQAASTAATVADAVTDLNALLTKLKAAGIMAPGP